MSNTMSTMPDIALLAVSFCGPGYAHEHHSLATDLARHAQFQQTQSSCSAYQVYDFSKVHRDLGALQVAVVAGVVNQL